MIPRTNETKIKPIWKKAFFKDNKYIMWVGNDNLPERFISARFNKKIV